MKKKKNIPKKRIPQKQRITEGNGQFAKGKPKTGGRQKGTQNKFTRTVKEAVLETFNKLQGDKRHNLFSWGKKHPTEFYKIAAKLIPTEITGGDGKPLIPQADLSKLTDAELRTLIDLQSKSRTGTEISA